MKRGKRQTLYWITWLRKWISLATFKYLETLEPPFPLLLINFPLWSCRCFDLPLGQELVILVPPAWTELVNSSKDQDRRLSEDADQIWSTLYLCMINQAKRVTVSIARSISFVTRKMIVLNIWSSAIMLFLE